MTDLTSRLRKLAEFDSKASYTEFNTKWDWLDQDTFEHHEVWVPAQGAENARLRPLLDALLECVGVMTEAAEYSRMDDCNGYAGELCAEAIARLEQIAKEIGDE